MQYLCLVYCQSERWQALPACRQHAVLADTRMVEQRLRESGNLLCSGTLEADEATVHVRVDGETVSVRATSDLAREDPPGGYLLIQARDLNDAIRIAARLPLAEAGYIEVRPVRTNARYGEM